MAEEQTEEPHFAAPTGEGEAAEKQSSACRTLSCSFPGHSAQVQPTVLLPQPEERSESVTDRWLKLFLGKKNQPPNHQSWRRGEGASTLVFTLSVLVEVVFFWLHLVNGGR